ncbi:unknown [Bacteroides sp. CAG:443]|mgnify:FL=1|nr:unknown [Bacteroides sp. CAG:443]
MIELKNRTNIISVIEELYFIKKEKRGLFASKIVEIENLIMRSKEDYMNGNLISFENINKSKRQLGKVTYFPDGSCKENIEEYDATTRTLENTIEIKKNRLHDIFYYKSYYHRRTITGISNLNCSQYELTYNEIDKLTLEKHYYNGMLDYIKSRKYDNCGNCINEITQFYHENQNYKEQLIINRYDSHNNLNYQDTQIRYKLQLKDLEGKDNRTICQWEYEYNDLGDIVLMKDYDNGNLTIYKYDIKYDSHNNCIERRAYISGYKANNDILRKYFITYK